jgi:ligand-binding sensor domain-containing protein
LVLCIYRKEFLSNLYFANSFIKPEVILKYQFQVIIFIYLTICSFTQIVWSQAGSTYIKKVTGTEGLNSQSIFDLYVSNEGLLYLGTDKGLVSYNGVFFSNYAFKDNLALSLNRIQEDSKGTIWCKNFSNQVFYMENDTLKPDYRVEKYLNDNNENLIDFAIVNDQFYFLTEQNLYTTSQNGELKTLFNATKLNTNVFYTMHVTNNVLFLAGDSKIFEIKNQNIQTIYSSVNGQKELLYANNQLFYILKGQQNQLISASNGSFNNNLIPENTYYNSLSATSSGIWLNTTNGLYKMDSQQLQMKEQLLPNQRVSDVVEDHEGGSWISTLDDGLYYIPSASMYKLQTQQTNKAPANFISLAKSADGHLFAGTSNGHIIEYDTNMTPVFNYKGSSSLEIEYIFLDDNRIFSSIGVFRRNKANPVIDAYFGKGLAEDDFGNFVFANYNLAGLIPQSLNGKPNVIAPLSTTSQLSYYVNDFQIYSFRNKRSRVANFNSTYQCYYIGYSDALIKIGIDGTITEITTKNKKPIIAIDFLEDHDGALWVASSQQGLIKVVDNEVVLQINERNGLTNNKCKKIKADNNGIWILNEGGFDYLNLKTKQLANYGNQLGLSDISINDFAINDTYVWFATNEGIVYFNTSILNQSIKPVFSLSATNQNQLPINQDTALSYQDNQVIFQFNTIYYKGLSNYQYEYKLLPLQDEWQTQNAKQTQLNFLALKPNNYQLQVRIKTGTNYTDIKTFSFKINKPFWSQTWFNLLVLITLVLLLYTVYRWAVLKTKKQQRIREMLAISQLTALRSQMNPHFMFNVLNAVQGLIYSNQKSKANEYLGTFSTLMRKTLDVSDKRDITIAQEVETIELYVSLEQARFEENNFTYKIILPDEDLNQFIIPSLIIQPFVENAIKHGLMHKRGQKNLQIEVLKENEYYWEFIIEDNGVGRKASAHINEKIKNKPQSFATNAIDNRIFLINKLIEHPIKINIEDLSNTLHQSTGTRVTIHIPVRRLTN